MTKAEIVQAAFKVWGRQLYQNTSLSSLAKELGVSKPALYRHFKSKQALMAAMNAQFFDEYTAFALPDYERAMSGKNPEEGIFILLRSITGFFAGNADAFIFSLINIYDHNADQYTASKHMKVRGMDMERFDQIVQQTYNTNPLLMRLIISSLIFFVADFHKTGKSYNNPPSEEDIQRIIKRIEVIIVNGLGYKDETVDTLAYGELENRISAAAQQVEAEPLMRAVAQAVAEAGPWKASMDMVARRSGLSKSSLYSHFKNKQDMLSQLFVTEFKRILAFACQGTAMSSAVEEQLYLGIFSIAVYLRSRPEILVAMDWIRTRNLDFGRRKKPDDFFHLFEDIDIGVLPGENPDCGGPEKRRLCHWILFLLVNILMKKNSQRKMGNVQNSDIRTLYRFLTMGLKGFKR